MATVDKPSKPARGRPPVSEDTKRTVLRMAKEGASYLAIAEHVGIHERTVRRILTRKGFKRQRPMDRPRVRPSRAGMVRVPNAPLRDAVEASGVPLTVIAEALGFVQVRATRGGERDSTRLRRSLGISPSYGKTADGVRRAYYQSQVPIELAERVCQIIGVDFDELYPEVAEQEPAMVCKGCGAEMRKAVRGKLCGLCIEEQDPVPFALAVELEELAGEWVA